MKYNLFYFSIFIILLKHFILLFYFHCTTKIFQFIYIWFFFGLDIWFFIKTLLRSSTIIINLASVIQKKKNLASHHYNTNIVISNKINILLLPFFFLYRINILILPSSFFSFIELTFFFHYMCHVCVVSPSMTLTVFFHYRTQLMLVDLLRESSTTLMDYQI